MASTSNRRPRESVNEIIDERYRLVRLIGEGGMGHVFEAEHVGIGKRVALKILHAVFSNVRESVERFRAEARMTSRIANPHIIDVTDSGTTADGRLYFVMEYLDGRELSAVMNDGNMSLERSLLIARQIGEALAAAHGAGVIHRDLKPENIVLIERDGIREFVKVLDFGIALAVDGEKPKRRLTMPGLTVGTPEYMAPEQALDATADERSDIYALGAMLYEMATGQQPYKGETFTQILVNKVNSEPPRPRELRGDLPEEVEALIMKAMARKPADRHQSMGEVVADVAICLATLEKSTLTAPPSRAAEAPSVPPRGDAPTPPARPVLATPSPPVRTAPVAAHRTPPPIPTAVDPTAATVSVSAITGDQISPAVESVDPVPEKRRSRALPLLLLLVLAGAAGAYYVLVHSKKQPAAAPAPAPASPTAKPAPAKPAPAAAKPAPAVAKAVPAAETATAPAAKPEPVRAAPPPKTLKQARTFLAKAQAAQKKKSWDVAREHYDRVARGKFATAQGQLGLAEVALGTGDPALAVKHAKTSVKNGGGAPARRVLAKALAAQKKKKKKTR